MTEKITEDKNYSSSSSVYRGGVSKADGGVYTTIFQLSLYKQRESWVTLRFRE